MCGNIRLRGDTESSQWVRYQDMCGQGAANQRIQQLPSSLGIAGMVGSQMCYAEIICSLSPELLVPDVWLTDQVFEPGSGFVAASQEFQCAAFIKETLSSQSSLSLGSREVDERLV